MHKDYTLKGNYCFSSAQRIKVCESELELLNDIYDDIANTAESDDELIQTSVVLDLIIGYKLKIKDDLEKQKLFNLHGM